MLRRFASSTFLTAISLISGLLVVSFSAGCGGGGGGSSDDDDDCAVTIEQIIDATGDGVTAIDAASSVAVDSRGHVYVASVVSDSVFEITPGGDIAVVIGPAGDGVNALESPADLAVDGDDNLYVAGQASDNVFRVTPGGDVSQIASLADGLDSPRAVVADEAGNAYVAGGVSNNVLRIEPNDDVSEILTAVGTGTDPLSEPSDLAIDADGHIVVAGLVSNNLIRVEPTGANPVELVDADGDGAGNEFNAPSSIAADRDGNVYAVVNSFVTRGVFRIDDADAVEFLFDTPFDPGLVSQVAVDRRDRLHVSDLDRVAELDGEFEPETLIDADGDDAGHPLTGTHAIAFGPDDEVYVTGRDSNNAFRIDRCD